ncbi:MAG: VaFE repeat-containing surface-anchored protein [Firmicutes bacterium]|nr:VaFE repeat-containing surface-anchored protein [Bacillota bacterium]
MAQSSGTLAGAQYRVNYYDNQTAYSDPLRSWVFETDARGRISLIRAADFLVSGDPFYYDDIGAVSFPIGCITIQEIKAPEGYAINQETITVHFTLQADGTVRSDLGKWNTTNQVEDLSVFSEEQIILGGVKLEKWDKETRSRTPQGDADFTGIQFQITTLNANPVLVSGKEYTEGQVVYTLITDDQGNAQTAPDLLPYGTYSIKEVETNGKYRLTSGAAQTFTILAEGQIVSASTSGSTIIFENEVVRGSAAIIKQDADLASGSQGNASFEGIRFAVVNRSLKAVIVNETAYAAGQVIAVVSADASGSIPKVENLPYGTYQIYELRADAAIAAGESYDGSSKLGASEYANDNGYLYQAQDQRVTITKDGEVAAVSFTDEPVKGGVGIAKWDSELDGNRPQGDAELSGIKFEITNKSANAVIVDGTEYGVGEVVATLTTDRNGAAETPADMLPYGTYAIREAETNTGYLLTDGTARTFEIRENGVVVEADTAGTDLVFKNIVVRGGVSFLKIDKEMNEAKDQGQATLEGAAIEIYNASSHSILVDGTEYAVGEAVMTLTTDADGKAATGANALPYGTYYAVEGKESEGYLPSDWRVDFQIREDGVIVDTSSDDSKVEQGADKSGWFKVTGNSSASVPGVAGAQLPEQIKRLDIQFTKVDIDGTPMAGIPFLISLLDKDGNVIESHVIVSDANGGVNTANRPKRGTEVNALDEYVRDGKFTDESQLSGFTGVWFGAADPESQAAKKGSLIYGQYRIEELRCSSNEGQVMLKQKVFTIDPKSEADSDLAVEFVDGTTKTLGNIFIDMMIHPESDLIDVLSGTKVATLGPNAAYRDTIRYDHLKITQEYKIKTEIYYEDKAGTITKLGENTITFTPAKADASNTAHGTIYNEVTIDASKLNGGKLHAVDYFYATVDGEDVELVNHNVEMKEERQTIVVPYMSTTASDSKTNDHVGTVKVEAEINDIVHYENLADKGMYRLVGILKEASTGEIVKGADGNDCVVEAVLRIDKRQTEVAAKDYGFLGPASGDVKMPAFKFDATAYEGKTLVVTEILFDNDLFDESAGWEGNEDAIIIHHDSLTDENQSVHYITVQTEAEDEKTGTRTAVVGSSEAAVKEKIVDTVTITNAIPGQTYKVTGSLYFNADYKDGNGVEHKQGDLIAAASNARIVSGAKPADSLQKEPIEVAAESDTIVVEVEFEVDSSMLEGTSGVVFEDVWHNGINIAKHHDFTTEAQTPHWPKVRTTAMDADTRTHTGRIDEDNSKNTVIVDTVTLTNLNVGDSYKVVGTLKFKDTGADVLVDGQSLVVESEVFEATEANMTKELTFEFNSTDLKGKSVVVFEKLFFVEKAEEEGGEDKEVEVNRHEDLTDDGQTVNFVDGKTTATDSETKDHIAYADEKVTINDHLTYKNLTIGETYEATGVLMVKETQQPLLVNGKEVTNTITFTAQKKDGEIIVPLTFDASILKGQTFVVFENVRQNGIDVFIEHNIEDDDQTVVVPEIHTNSADGVTEDHIALAEEKMTLTDTIIYKNMLPDREYHFIGKLMIRETGEPLLVDGKEVTAEKTVTLTEANGELDMVFEFNGIDLRGKTIVVFEAAFLITEEGEKIVAGHEDLTDEAQSEHVPDGHTTASDGITGDHVGHAAEKVYVKDSYYYSNLIPDREYTVLAKLYIRETGEALKINGKEVTKEVTFTASKPDGVVEIEFDPFDGSALMGQTIIVGETLRWKDFTVHVHFDLKDEDQSIHYPEIGTSFTDSATQDHIAAATEKITLIDTVTFKNVVPGKTYEMKAEIYDKETGKSLGYTETVEFTPDTANGTVDVEFTLDRSKVTGKSLVTFETLLFTNDLGVTAELADHEDIEDEGQTVHVPEVHTTATDSDTGNHTSLADEDVTIIDRVFYTNLMVGKEYTVSGTLMQRDQDRANSEKPILIGDEPFTVTKTFTAEKADGYVDIEFKFNGKLLAGRTVVAFEEVLYEGIPVAVHADLNDEEQTIHFLEPEKPDTPKTGDDTNVSLYAIMGTAAAAGLGILLSKKKKEEESDVI